ncbi:MAG TPA: efflux RND transporter periplasmic adaptor subunit [Albitalea sp.]
MPILTVPGRAAIAALALAAACAAPEREMDQAEPMRRAGTIYTVADTTIRATFDASGVAAPVQQATLSTKVMGTVTAVLVHEGDAVRAGQPLVRIDARELGAKSAQVAASVAEAEAMHRDAVTQAGRIRALYADSAATRAQLDAVETGLARAEAGLRNARAAAAELDAVSSYAEIRAPFSGLVTKRFVDPGAFAVPGAPLVAVQDARELRLTVSAAPDAASGLRRGQQLDATIEGRAVRATVEGVVPAMAGNLYTINARVPNPDGAILAGSSATLAIPLGERSALLVPVAAIAHEGDLTGVTLRTTTGDVTRWVRLGAAAGEMVEVTAGLRAGDQVVVPPPLPHDVARRN